MASRKIQQKETTIKKKLKELRKEKSEHNDAIENSEGSRKMKANNYVKEADKGEPRGCPFPKNLRPSRRNRPKNIPPKPSYQISLAEIEARNPIVVTDRDVELSEAHKSLCRKGATFVPTPTVPVNNMEIYEDWLQWRNRTRWKWFHVRKRDFDNETGLFLPSW